MKASSVIAALVVVAGASVSGCAIKPKAQFVFEDVRVPPKTASRDWKGEAITVENAGIEPENELGGVEIIVAPEATRVSVTAVFAAHSDDDKYPNAQQSMDDAMKTFVIEETATSFDIKCGHGETHGTARAVGSGCRTLRVTIPAGSATQPHALAVTTGSGAVRIGIGEAPFAKSIVVDDRGPSAVEVRARPVKDAMLAVTGRSTVSMTLPADFSAKKVLFDVAEAEGTPREAGIVTTDFPGMASGAPYPLAGPAAEAVTELKLGSTGALEPALIRISKL